jgi:Fic family protein
MLAALVSAVEQKKADLDRLRPLTGDALAQLQKYYDVELTYTSNAIEGNTLTHRETAEVIEHGITVGGKSLREHLEAVDHYEALQWMRGLAAQVSSIDEDTVCELHRRIVARSQRAPSTLANAFAAHFRLTAIHPFSDGNGRTARLLMNLMLIRGAIRRLPSALRIASHILTRWSADRSAAIFNPFELSCMSGWTQRWTRI